MKLTFFSKAKKSLLLYQKKDKKLFIDIVDALDELEEKNIESSSIKTLVGVENGYRKRVGRHRILFTVHYENDEMKIWIIDIEKDTQKDYKKWIAFILSKLDSST